MLTNLGIGLTDKFDKQNQEFFKMLGDYTISEVVMNGHDSILFKRSGAYYNSDMNFTSPEDYFEFIRDNLIPYMGDEYVPGKQLYEESIKYTEPTPGSDSDQSRARCTVIMPKTVEEPSVTIAKKSRSLKSIEKIASSGSMSTEMMEFIKDAVKAELTIVFSGSTGSGKTTMMESICTLIPENLRIGVAEDVPELKLPHKNIVYARSSPAQNGETPAVSLEWIIQQAQRMRFDRILCGEIRGREFSNFLVAANSGIDGSMTTMHADTPDECKKKMTRFALSGSGTNSLFVVNNEISSVVDIIIQLTKEKGKYRCTHIHEVSEVISESNPKISGNDLYVWDSLTDTFVKRSNISDTLQRKMRKKGVDPHPYLISDINKPFPAHNSTLAGVIPQHKTSGLPRFM